MRQSYKDWLAGLGLNPEPIYTAPPPAPPPTCPTTYRIKSPAETGDVVLHEDQLLLAGKPGYYVGRNPSDGIDLVQIGRSIWTADSHLIVRETIHQFPDWGTRRVRCECCDAWGFFDNKSGTYKAATD